MPQKEEEDDPDAASPLLEISCRMAMPSRCASENGEDVNENRRVGQEDGPSIGYDFVNVFSVRGCAFYCFKYVVNSFFDATK